MSIDEAVRQAVTEAVRQVVREEVQAALAQLGEPARAGAAEFLTLKEAAEVARVHVSTIRDWLTAGKLKRYFAGKRLRVSRAELVDLLACAPEGGAKPRTVEASVTRLLKRT